MNAEQILGNGVKQLGVEVDPQIQQNMLNYLGLLHKWNRTYNLTSIRQPEQMVIHHLLDSLAVLPHLWPGKWLDVGCGAGLPGLVLALMRPTWSFTMVDSNSKKTSFVQQAAIELKLNNVKVICVRVEQWHPVEKYDGIISRAFAEISDFTKLTKHLLTLHGGWAAMKGKPEQEIKQIAEGIEVEKIVNLQIPNLNAARSLVILRST